MPSAPCIWLTRPTADSAALAEQLAAAHIQSIIAPVMEITLCPISSLPATMPDALLLTSRHASNAWESLPESWRALPIYCVGPATSSAMRAKAATVIEGEGDMARLLPLLTQLPRGTTLLYLRGEEVSTDVPTALSPYGITVAEAVCYRTTPCATSPALHTALTEGRITAVTCYSAHSATRVCQWVTDAQAAQMDCFVLSETVKKAAALKPWRSIHTAPAPEGDAMLALIRDCCR